MPPVRILLAALTLSTASPATPASESCAELLTAESPASAISSVVPPGILEGMTWSSLAREYVHCSIEEGVVQSIVVTESGLAVLEYVDGSYIEFAISSDATAWLIAYAAESGVVVSVSSTPDIDASSPSAASPTTPPSILGIITFSMVVIAAVVGGWWYVKKRPKKVAASGATDTARVKKSDIPDTRFTDIAGCKEAIEDLAEMVDVLTHPERYTALGARTPKGALLVGPPGTGKTLLARAVAGEAGVPFFSAAGSDFVEMYVGVGARRIRDVFSKAKKAGRAIVFIDEIDAVGRRRAPSQVSAGESEHENTLIALLNELDGFTESGVVVLAATNRPEVLDGALTRPGRLDRRVHVGLPDVAERAQVLQVHSRGKRFAPDVSFDSIARRTPGMSGAQLEQVCNEAALIAAREQSTQITDFHVRAAVEYVAMGRARRSATVSLEDRRITAWHEAGHTVAALKTPNADRPVSVSIIPRGAAGGATWMEGSDSIIVSRSSLRARLVVALAGRAAEETLLAGEHTAGAANDLEQATEIARAMVERFGMTEYGLAVRSGSSDTEAVVDQLLRTAYDEARTVLAENNALLEHLADALLEKDDLTSEDLDSIAALY